MSENQYENFKQGIKNDVRDYGLSIYLLGGLLILAGIMFSVLVVVIKDDKMDAGLRLSLGFGTVALALLMTFNARIRLFIVKAWILILVAIPFLLILILVGYMFYNVFSKPLTYQ